MKPMILKKKTILLSLMLLFAVSLLCFGCTPDTEQPKDEPENKQSEVYIVSDSSRTTNKWEMKYGAIKADGTMVLPMEYTQVIILEDLATGEPLYLRTYELTLKEGVTVTKDVVDAMREDYYGDMNQNASQYFNHEYKLYNMNGELVEDMGSQPIYQICGDLVRYKDKQLIHQPSGEVLFNNADIIRWEENCHIIVYDQYQRVCVMDKDLNILLDIEGSEGFTSSDGTYYLRTREDEKRGLCRLDGTQVVPNEYDYFMDYYSYETPYIQAHQDDRTFVISLEDGSVIYKTESEYDYVQDLFADCMVIQHRYETDKSRYNYYNQLYDYQGNPISDKYASLSTFGDYYRKTLAETGEGVLYFMVTDMDGSKYLMDKDGNALYILETDGWVDVIETDRIIVSDYAAGTSGLYDLAGKQLNEKEYTSMNQMYLASDNLRYNRSELIFGNYQYNNMWLQDVLDADGNILLERLKSVTMLSEDLFWVEKGFSQGLMDRSGNWLYEQSLFNGAADE